MALNAIAGKPGTLTGFGATPIEIFYGSRPTGPDSFIPGPVTVDGTLSGNPLNTPYVWLLQAGQLMGKVTATGKYAASVLGVTTVAYTSGGTTLTVSAATAVELARRIGSSGTATFSVVGPPTAAGTVATTNVTYSAVNQTTGAITVTSLGVDKVIGSLLIPVDGSGTPTTVVCDQWGLKVIDSLNTTRTDVFDAELYCGKGIIDETKLLNWPADTSTQAWAKAGLRTNFPAIFRGDIANS